MFADHKDEIKACIKNNKRCKYLIGCLEINPILVSCTKGNNCKVASCCFYMAD